MFMTKNGNGMRVLFEGYDRSFVIERETPGIRFDTTRFATSYRAPAPISIRTPNLYQRRTAVGL